MSGAFSKAWERKAFAALVAHPYGYAGLELSALRVSNKAQHYRSRDGRKFSACLQWSLDLIFLWQELAKARARARGRA